MTGHATSSKPAAATGRASRPSGSRVFFPAAALYAAIVLPVSVLSITGVIAGLPGLRTPVGHAHEMLFGFAFAVVAGNQVGPTTWARLVPLATLWALGRVAFLFAPLGVLAAAADVLFAASLVWRVTPRQFASVKKPRNYALPLALTTIGASSIAFHIVQHVGSAAAQRTVLLVAVLLFALLMLFMGGRIIAPAAAGQFYRQGRDLSARVQPRVEGALIVAMITAVLSISFSAFGWWATAVGATACGVAGVLAAIRLARWQLWAMHGRPDLLCLGAGYAWLALGLMAIAHALLTHQQPTTALHIITVGSIGTLTLNVMALAWTHEARQDPARARLPVWGTLFIAAATVARIAAGFDVNDARVFLWLAAAGWSTAFVLLFVRLTRLYRQARKPRIERSAGAEEQRARKSNPIA